MFITSWTIDIRMNIQIWLLYRRYKSEWYNFWWATIQDIAACGCKVWTLFGQACGQEECSQTTTTTTMTTTTMTMTTTTDKSGLHRLATDILSWANYTIKPYITCITDETNIQYAFRPCTVFCFQPSYLSCIQNSSTKEPIIHCFQWAIFINNLGYLNGLNLLKMPTIMFPFNN